LTRASVDEIGGILSCLVEDDLNTPKWNSKLSTYLRKIGSYYYDYYYIGKRKEKKKILWNC